MLYYMYSMQSQSLFRNLLLCSPLRNNEKVPCCTRYRDYDYLGTTITYIWIPVKLINYLAVVEASSLLVSAVGRETDLVLAMSWLL